MCDEFKKNFGLTMSNRRISFHNCMSMLSPHILRKSMFHSYTAQSFGLRVIRPMLNMWRTSRNCPVTMSPVNIDKGISTFENSQLIDSSFRILVEIHGIWRIGIAWKSSILLVLAFENFDTGHLFNLAPLVFFFLAQQQCPQGVSTSPYFLP